MEFADSLVRSNRDKTQALFAESNPYLADKMSFADEYKKKVKMMAVQPAVPAATSSQDRLGTNARWSLFWSSANTLFNACCSTPSLSSSALNVSVAVAMPAVVCFCDLLACWLLGLPPHLIFFKSCATAIACLLAFLFSSLLSLPAVACRASLLCQL
jgi:hypothetical protein